MKLYLNTFVLVGVTMTAITHAVARTALPWWPDSAAIGTTFATLTTLSVLQHNRNLRRVWTMLRTRFGAAGNQRS